jgi:CRP-like cAMP-binding protein
MTIAKAKLLSQADLFAGLSTDQLTGIAELCQEVTCAEGETLFREGQEAKKLYILLEGKINLQVWLASQREYITVEVINKTYQTIGWSGLVPPYFYTSSAVCQTDSRFLAMDGPAFYRLLEQDPFTGFVVMRRITEVVCDRLRNTRVVLLKFIGSGSSED